MVKRGDSQLKSLNPSAINWKDIFDNNSLKKSFFMDTDKRVVTPFVYCFGLQNLRRQTCSRAIKSKLYGGRQTFISVHIGRPKFQMTPTIRLKD